MEQLFNIENLNQYWNLTLQARGPQTREGVYSVITGCYCEGVSAEDKKRQKKFVDWTQSWRGRKFFNEDFAPRKSFNDSNEHFCRVASNGLPSYYFWLIKHRLYFNFGDDRMNFLKVFVEKCNDRKRAEPVQYFLKWDKNYKRRDNLVIYCTDDNIDDVARVLEEIKREYPEFATPRELPLAAENMGWFAYGVEKKDAFWDSASWDIKELVIQAAQMLLTFPQKTEKKIFPVFLHDGESISYQNNKEDK